MATIKIPPVLRPSTGGEREVSAVGEELRLGRRVLRGDRAQHGADVVARGVDLALTVRRRAQDRGNANSGHGGPRGYPAAAQNAS